MTELVDSIIVRVTLRHDLPSDQTRGRTDLRAWLRDCWPYVAPWVSMPDQKGKLILLGGAIEIEWEQSGMHEIPELTGGDN